MTEKEVKEYIEFMYNKDNCYQCSRCPANDGFDSGSSGNRKPCGQYQCWVIEHCKHN